MSSEWMQRTYVAQQRQLLHMARKICSLDVSVFFLSALVYDLLQDSCFMASPKSHWQKSISVTILTSTVDCALPSTIDLLSQFDFCSTCDRRKSKKKEQNGEIKMNNFPKFGRDHITCGSSGLKPLRHRAPVGEHH